MPDAVPVKRSRQSPAVVSEEGEGECSVGIIMDRLLHPALLITRYIHWTDNADDTPVMLSAQLDPVFSDRDTLYCSGLEATMTFRILQEVRQQQVMSAYPFILDVSHHLLLFQDIGRYWDRILNFNTLSHPLILNVRLDENVPDISILEEGIQRLKNLGCQIVFNYEELRGECRILRSLCDGVRVCLPGTDSSNGLHVHYSGVNQKKTHNMRILEGL